jgi:hypothetical protein
MSSRKEDSPLTGFHTCPVLSPSFAHTHEWWHMCIAVTWIFESRDSVTNVTRPGSAMQRLVQARV